MSESKDKCFGEDFKSEKCPTGWNFKTTASFGRGCTGEVVQACCGNDCNYAAKWIPFGLRDGIFYFPPKWFDNEVKMLKYCNEDDKESPCVEYVDSKKYNHGGLLIMKPLNQTLLEFIIGKLADQNFVEVVLSSRLAIIRAIIDCFYLMKRLHRRGILHNDAHTSNIMMMDNTLLEIEVMVDDDLIVKVPMYKWYIIDMAKTEIIENMTKDIRHRDFEFLKNSILFDVEQALGPNIFDATILNNGKLNTINLLDTLFIILEENWETSNIEQIWQQLQEETTYFSTLMVQ